MPDQITTIVEFLRSKIAQDPVVGVICGSGLSGLSKTLDNPTTIKYEDIDGFVNTGGVQGHVGELVFGEMGDKYVVCMRGRFHYYSGWSPKQVSLPVRVMAALGCKMLVVTNAAGGVNPNFQVGNVMIINNHIYLPGLAGIHPLVGHNDDRFGPRFPAVSYDEELQQTLREAAKRVNFASPIREGIYVGVSGPTYETQAEIEYLRGMHGDAVGMSTVPEVIVAAHAGMRVLGLSIITNQCIGLSASDKDLPTPTHQEVLDAVGAAEVGMQQLVREAVILADLSNTEPTKAALHFARNAKSEAAAKERAARGDGGMVKMLTGIVCLAAAAAVVLKPKLR